MKNRPQLAPPRSLGMMSEAELEKIHQEVIGSLSAARVRLEGGKAVACGTGEGRDGPQATGAPSTNRGVKSENGPVSARLVLEDGEVKEIPARRGWGGESAFIDWVNFTTDEVDFFFGTNPVTDPDVMDLISYRCKEIYGFGITEQYEGGRNFYKRAYKLGDSYGMVCIGGQRSTVLVMLSGEGCAAAREGWESRLHDFLTKCGSRAKLTRVDLSHDFYHGELHGPVKPGQLLGYSVDQADSEYDQGLFCSGGRMPEIEHRGNWKRPNGKGRTLYIGSRQSGKYCRIYEKGKQLGDKSSSWCRVEVEVKSINRIIPFDVLLRPGEYLAASYPAFAMLSERQERILTTQKSTEIKYDAMVRYVERQCGAAINVMCEIEIDIETVIEKIRKLDCIPARLKIPGYQFGGESIHERERPAVNEEIFFEQAFS